MTRARRLRDRPRVRWRLDPNREIELHHVTDGPARGWLHTHGLAAHGLPELEMRNVPLFLGKAAAGVLNDLADYLLNEATAPLLAGQLVRLGHYSVQVVAGQPDQAAGYDPEHYADIRLVVVDAPEMECACEECARELAQRPSLLS
ncbi:MAG TPA: hypothetical protein VLC54_12875 [Anaeromyxobacter sp.]|nr:hypothetical protein [Anaeromyxobacter sp.]